ncbi:unnamed protein product [Lactuca virosa]|uniref:SWIM-type domain-containing protein n=1 Tax=Lactuca virosa TaxID=75947 RepID=A0AAU9MJ91_9ASTR|nr:unnamed protein product [Lactuca virosa]
MYVCSCRFSLQGGICAKVVGILGPCKKIVRDVDFGGFTYKEFILWLTKLTEGDYDNVYYCNRNQCLVEGIRRIDSDADYQEFVEAIYSDAKLDVYIDHQNEPILDWADNEVLADDISDDNEYDLDEEDDKDSEISNTTKYEH